jgi:hypothetical protein
VSPLRAELSGGGAASTATAAGITVQADAPVLALCRRLLAAGHDPATALEAYRGSNLCLRLRSIGESGLTPLRPGFALIASAERRREPAPLPRRPWPVPRPSPRPNSHGRPARDSKDHTQASLG